MRNISDELDCYSMFYSHECQLEVLCAPSSIVGSWRKLVAAEVLKY